MNLLHNRPLALSCICFLLFSVLSVFLATPVKFVLLGLSLLLTVLCLIMRKRKPRFSYLGALLCIPLVLASVSSLWKFDRNTALTEPYHDKTVSATLEVTDILYHSEYYHHYAVETRTVDGESVRLSLSVTANESFKIGDTLSGSLTVRSLSSETSSERIRLWSQGVFARGTLTSYEKTGHRNTPRALAAEWNESLTACVRDRYNDDASSLIAAMLLGNRSELSPSVTYQFRRVGVSHLLALSGMHISILAFAVLQLGSALRIPKQARGVILIILLAAFSCLTGLSSSILRAAIMTAMVEFGMLLRRENDSFTSLFFAAALIVAFGGNACLDIGLWLSVFATFGILLAVPVSERLFTKTKGFKRIILLRLLSPILFTLFATVLTMPLTALFFGQISILGVPANLVFPTLMTVFIYLSLLSFPLPFLRGAVSLVARGFLGLLSVFSACPSALIPFGQGAVRVILLIALGVILLWAFFKWRHPRRVLIPLALCLVALVSVVTVSEVVTARDVSAVYLTDSYTSENEFFVLHEDGRVVLIDIGGGDSTAYSRAVAPEIQNLGETEVDLLYIGHYHAGMEQRVARVLSTLYIREVVVPVPHTSYEEVLYLSFSAFCEKEHIRLTRESSDHATSLGDIRIESYARSASDAEETDAAIAFRFSVGGKCFLYTTANYSMAVLESDESAPTSEPEIIILGKHGKSAPNAHPAQFPFRLGAETLLLCNPDAGIRMSEEEKAAFLSLEVIPAPLVWRMKFD